MHGVIGDVEKEGFLLIAGDKIDRFLRDPRGEVAFLFDGFETTIDWVIHVGMVKVGMRPASHETVKLIEPAIHGVVSSVRPRCHFPRAPET